MGWPRTRTALAFAIVALAMGTEAALFLGVAPQAMRGIVNVVVGVVIAKFGTVYDFYFGSAKPPAD